MSKTAFLFPGQGSQSVGMLSELAGQSALVKQTFDQASEVLGRDLWKLTQDGPEEQLNQTETTQPAMLAAGIACWRAWKEGGGFDPDFMAGHSLGEYSALVAAGCLEFADAVLVVSERARLMQSAVPTGSGAMAAIIGLENEPLEQVCAEAAQGGVVSCANFNSPGQVVIAGDTGAVGRACALALEAGARRAIPLAVSVPSHCALMRDAARTFSATLNQIAFQSSGIPVLHNVDGRARGDADAIRSALENQMWQPVRWVETIEELARKGVSRLAECGPGKVLAGLNRRISRDLESVALFDLDSMKTTMTNWS
ncbi:MAG TPA: ACP S-malonyltransferase [Xanthomonadales bacterium]|nr:ACP S-malonyltransferase [Xanthomonadales bacterium]